MRFYYQMILRLLFKKKKKKLHDLALKCSIYNLTLEVKMNIAHSSHIKHYHGLLLPISDRSLQSRL